MLNTVPISLYEYFLKQMFTRKKVKSNELLQKTTNINHSICPLKIAVQFTVIMNVAIKSFLVVLCTLLYIWQISKNATFPSKNNGSLKNVYTRQ